MTLDTTREPFGPSRRCESLGSTLVHRGGLQTHALLSSDILLHSALKRTDSWNTARTIVPKRNSPGFLLIFVLRQEDDNKTWRRLSKHVSDEEGESRSIYGRDRREEWKGRHFAPRRNVRWPTFQDGHFEWSGHAQLHGRHTGQVGRNCRLRMPFCLYGGK